MGPNLYFGFYFDVPPITQIVTKAQRVLAFKPADFLTGLKETYRWYLRHHERKEIDYSFEDRLMNSSAQPAMQAGARSVFWHRPLLARCILRPASYSPSILS